MKNRKCPNHKACWDYGSCENCELGKNIARLHKRIERLKKQNETLTIQRNAWALTAKAIKADTIKKMQERLRFEIINKPSEFRADQGTVDFLNGSAHKQLEVLEIVDQIAKEILEGK